jgi:hypothetical protein
MRYLLAAFLLATAIPSRAISADAGTSGAQFLKLGAGARAGAMGDSFAAIADDASAAYYNPAGLAQLPDTQLGGAHTSYFQGVNYEVLNFTHPIAKEEEYARHTFAFSVYQLSINGIERRSNDTEDPTGKFGTSDAAYALSYAYGASRRLSFGATGKYIAQTLDTYHSSAYALDAGVLYHMNPDASRPLSLAATVRNAGSRVGYVSSQTDPLPTSLTGSASCAIVPKLLRVNLDLTKYRDENAFAALGGEFTHAFNDAASGAFRFGYSTERKDNPGSTVINGLSFGAGVSFRKAAFDFAWIPFGGLGDTFRYSLLIKF